MTAQTAATARPDELRIIASTQPQAKLYLAKDFVVHSQHPKPNRWHRFWQRVLLGWEWKDYQDGAGG